MKFEEKLADRQYYYKNKDSFYTDLCYHHGVNPDHNGIKAAYYAAYEIGHSCGFAEVATHFPDMIEVVFATENSVGKAKMSIHNYHE